MKRLPLRALDYSAICGLVELRFTSPLECDIKVSDTWNTSCKVRHNSVIAERLLNLNVNSMRRRNQTILNSVKDGRPRFKGLIELTQILKMTRALRPTKIQKPPSSLSQRFNKVIVNGLTIILTVMQPAFTAQIALNVFL
jgi:hypothetical protein